MRKYFLVFLSCSILLLGCSSKKQDASLPGTFLESLSKQKFELLAPYLPAADFYKSLGKEVKDRTDEEIAKFIEKSNNKVKEGWSKIIERLKTANIKPGNVEIKEIMVYSPFKVNKMQGMVVQYNYNDKTWDDIFFIVSEWNGKTYLLEIPNTEKFLSMEDTSLQASAEARLYLEMSKPGYQKNVQARVEKIIMFAKDNKVKEMAESMMYRGDDEKRKWKSAMTINDTDYVKRATEFMGQINNELKDCSDLAFDEIKSERESEGVWIVMPVKCGSKTIHFAFLSLNNQLLLGDIDAETKE